MKLTNRGRIVVAALATLAFLAALGFAGWLENLGY